MELGRAAGAAAVMGMISIPGRLSRHSMEDMLAPDCEAPELVPIGVILTEEGMYGLPSVRSRRSEEALLLRISASLLLSFCRL